MDGYGVFGLQQAILSDAWCTSTSPVPSRARKLVIMLPAEKDAEYLTVCSDLESASGVVPTF